MQFQHIKIIEMVDDIAVSLKWIGLLFVMFVPAWIALVFTAMFFGPIISSIIIHIYILYVLVMYVGLIVVLKKR